MQDGSHLVKGALEYIQSIQHSDPVEQNERHIRTLSSRLVKEVSIKFSSSIKFFDLSAP